MAEMTSAPLDAGAHALRIEVPDPASGFMLVQRLGGQCTLAGSETDGWVVAGPANGDLPHMLAAVQQWLRDEAIDHVAVCLGDHTHTMTRG
jgi:hypothetical protein